MKKFWEKFKVAIIVTVLLGLFVGLSFLLEIDVTPKESNEIGEDISAWVNDSLMEDYTLAVIAQSGCHFCQQYEPVIEEIKKDYPDLKIYWFHTDELSSTEYTTLSTTYDIEESFSGTPYTMLTYHGNLINYISGYVDEEELVKFLKDNKVISE